MVGRKLPVLTLFFVLVATSSLAVLLLFHRVSSSILAPVPHQVVIWWNSVKWNTTNTIPLVKNISKDIFNTHSQNLLRDLYSAGPFISSTVAATPLKIRTTGIFDNVSNSPVLFINSLDFTRLEDVKNMDNWSWNELLNPRLSVPGTDYEDCIEDIKMQVTKQSPQALVFVLSALQVNNDPPHLLSHYMVNQLKHFISLIQFVGDLKECKVVLVIQSSYESPVRQWWSRAFVLTLLSSLGQTGRASVIRVTALERYTSEKHENTCSDIEIVFKSVLVQGHSTEAELKFCPQNYPPVEPGKKVILSTYFTHGKYSQYNHYFKSNDFRFMRKWFQSGSRLGAKIVIFHDNLKRDFQERIRDYYSDVEFIDVKPTDFRGRTPNDGRFFIWHDYLSINPNIANVLATDIRDVAFLADPFKVMEAIGNYLYLGVDNAFHMAPWTNNGVSRNTQKCHAKDKDIKFILKYEPFYNAGVVGGTRNAVMNFFDLVIQNLKHTPPNMNCNMGTYSYVASKHFWNSSFTGYPFQSAFKIGLPGPTNVAIKHKVHPGNNVYDDSMD